MKLITILVFISILASFFDVFASPMHFFPIQLVQPGCDTINVFLSGDEFYNWVHDSENYTIIQDQVSGFYVYADLIGDKLVPTYYLVGKVDPKTTHLKSGLNIPVEIMLERRNRFFDNSPQDMGDAPTSGIINNLVIFIRFSGENEFNDQSSFYDVMFNDSLFGNNSMHNYFKEASYDQLTINSSFYPVPSGNTVISYQDSHTRGYYSPYIFILNPDGYSDTTQRREREHTLLMNAVNFVESQVSSSLNLDGDNDGKVDNICFIVYGSPGAWSELLWPHRWVLFSYAVNINGKRVWDYNFQLQTSLNSSGVGVLCHEMFHSLGAPDLYHYSQDGLQPVGQWDIMEQNLNPPQHMGAYMKFKYGHWISSIPELTTPGTYTLEPLISSTNNCFKIKSPNSASEYFVVEYRRRWTTFENSLPGEGLLVYRINTLENGNGNGPPDEVYIYRPNGTLNVNGDPMQANYSADFGRTSINDLTNPSSFLSNGNPGGLNIYDVGTIGNTIEFTYGGQGIDVALVLDHSGSMDIYGYMEPAKSAAKTFVGLMQIGDRIGVVSFNTVASVNFPLTIIVSDATKTAAQNAISAITSTGGTSVGAGLQAGQNQLNNGNTSVHQGMVLLSDGEENTPPWVSDILPTIPENTDIYTIALGPNSDQTLLNNIAVQTGGFYSFAPDAAGLQQIYNTIRARVTGQQVIANFSGVIAPAQTINHSAPVDGSVTNATFAVIWSGSNLNLELIDPNGRIINPDTALIDPNIEFSTGSTYEYYNVNSPVAGNWTLKIIAISVPSGGEDYNASVVGTAGLKMNISFNKDEYYRSEPILISANINEVGTPILNATVTADVISPTTASAMSFRRSRNNSKNEMSVENGISTPLRLVLENGIKKYYDEEGQLFYSNSTIQLFDDGLHNDGVANDGIYASYFLNTQVEGSYIFTINASGISPISGNFSREATISTVVGPPAVPDFTVNFTVSDTCTASQNLIFGTASDATDCIDIVYDCYAPPPPPPTVLSAWFGTCSEHLLCDFRTTNVNSEIIWNVNFQPVSGCPVKFSWNPLELPPDGNFYLVDLISGEINMRNQSSHTISSPGLTSVSIKYQRPLTFQLSVNVLNSWNMVSIPGLHPTDQNVNTWWAFRDQSANVFKYAGGYLSITDAVPGTGYWMKHSGTRTYNTGDEWPTGGIQIVAHDPIVAAAGWNLIGGYENSASVSGITTNPPGLQEGPVYGYSGGYQTVSNLIPGYGYWIKLTGAGQIILPNVLSKKSGDVVEYFPDDWGRIVFTDATGINYTLYAVNSEVNLDLYELPPAPPAGMFDIRFSSGRIAEDINSSIKAIDMSGVTYPLKVRVEGMDIRLMDESGKIVNINLKDGEDVVIDNSTINKLMVSGEMLPTVYSLEQNYPNPFNPSTRIKFSVPKEVQVNLSVFNILGERVKELKNEVMKPGYYEVEFNASNLASGIYIYRIKAGDFVETKKMVLIK